MDNIDFSALLCSRLCHDLVSPVGAISNGMELLKEEDDPEIKEQVMEMLSKSATQTATRLQFYRLAFGASGGHSSTINIREAHTVLKNLLSDTKIILHWDLNPIDVSKSLVKILLNMSLISVDALPRGGVLEVKVDEISKGMVVTINVSGDRVFFQAPEISFLNGENIDLEYTPRTTPAHLVKEILVNIGGKVEVFEGENSNITFKFNIY